MEINSSVLDEIGNSPTNPVLALALAAGQHLT
jgi:hypothetical protein